MSLYAADHRQGNSANCLRIHIRDRTVVHGLRSKSFMLVFRCHQLLSGLLSNGYLPECHVSHVCPLVTRLINSGLCIDHLAFTLRLCQTPVTSAKESSDEGCMASYCLKSDPLPPSDIVRIAQLYGSEKVIHEESMGNMFDGE